jgi:plastocyanin
MHNLRAPADTGLIGETTQAAAKSLIRTSLQPRKHGVKPLPPIYRRRRSGIGAPLVVLLVAALATVTAACGSSGRPSNTTSPSAGSAHSGASGTTIVIKNFAFVPGDLTVSPGAAVTVRNEDPTTHTLTAVSPHDKVFNTGNIAAGATKTFTAPNSAGSYSYICEIHQFMQGTLTVK